MPELPFTAPASSNQPLQTNTMASSSRATAPPLDKDLHVRYIQNLDKVSYSLTTTR
jgi:hypothetical protein